MKYALVNNVITEATSGNMGICRNCKSQVRGYDGDIQVAHWRHLSKSTCDTWFENETKWHRHWKNQFPSSWQETIIEEDGEKHIADVYNPTKKLTIEFQNSHLNVNTLKIREAFYGKMIWVVNTEPYKTNIILERAIPTKHINKIIQREVSKYLYLLEDYHQRVNELVNLVHEYESGKPWKTKYEEYKQALPLDIREDIANHILQVLNHYYKRTDIEVRKIIDQISSADPNFKKFHQLQDEISDRSRAYEKLPSQLLFFNWKYQHNQWNYSDKNVFLDLGDENVYWIKDFLKNINGFIVQTVSKKDFILHYANG